MQLLQPRVHRSDEETIRRGAPRFPAIRPSRYRWRRFREWCFVRAAAVLQPCATGDERTFGILTYHQVAPRDEHDVQMLSVTPERFRRQMEGLLRRGYQPLALQRVIQLHRASQPVPPRSFVVVFDDGYQGVYHHAWQVLRELRIPATIFLATAYLDQSTGFPFDAYRPRASAAENARPLSRSQCHEMLAGGWVTFGSHTHTHQDFRGRTDEFRHDLIRSLEVLRDEFDCREAAFAFPFGFFDDRLIEAARDAGVSCCLTAENESVFPASDPFSWGRFGATQLDTSASLAAKLDGWYGFFRSVYRCLHP